MDIRYIYIRSDDATIRDSRWMNGCEPDEVESQAVSHASHLMQCSVLVVERDPHSGYMVPLGFAANL